MRLTVCFLLLLLSSMTTFAQQKPIVNFQVENQIGQPGDTICVPITASNFRDVQGIGFGIRWDTSALTYESLDLNQSLSNLSESDFGRTNVENGDLKVSWITGTFPDGLSLEDGAILFELCLVIKATASGGYYYVGFDADFIAPEVIVDDRVFAEPLGIANFTPGGIIVEDDNNALSIDPLINFDLACGSFEAVINPNVSGGVAPYDYAWRGEGVFFTNTASLTNFPNEGLYTLEVTDQEGNTITGTFWVDFMGNEDGLPFPAFQILRTPPSCDAANGSITLIPSDGNIDDFLYTWVGDGSNVADSLAAGDYSVTINSTSNDCFDAFTVQLRPSDPIEEFTVLDTILCIGDAIILGQSNENKPETASFLWSDGSTSSTITASEPGTYTLTVTEDFCSEITTFQIVRANEGLLSSDFQLIQADLSCGLDSVEIGVVYQGDIAGLTYSWIEGPSDSVRIVNAPGTYFLSIIDEQGCTIEWSFEILQEEGDFSINKVIEFQGCDQGNTLLSIETTDDKVYAFDWNTAETTSAISIMQGGTYAVTVTETESGCTQVVIFDQEEIGDPTSGTVSVNVDCIIEGNCYLGTRYDIEVSGYTAPISYTWSDGTTMMGGSEISTEIFSRQTLDLYISDAAGCTDTIRNLFTDCALQGEAPELNVRQYVVCEENEETGELDATLYNEVLGNLSTPPYIFNWGNGFSDTSYYRSSQPLANLPNLFIGVIDALGNRFSRQLSEPVDAYGCGGEETPVFGSEHLIIEPGASFEYPIYIGNHQGLERIVYTIDWDPCLLEADSIQFFLSSGDTMVDRNIFDGTYEAFFFQEGGSPSGDSAMVAKIFFKASSSFEGVSPFLYSVNEVATNGDGSISLVRPMHGSITVANAATLVVPGDADNNGRVNHFDLLNIGLAHGADGPDRRAQRIDQDAFAYSWLRATPKSSIDLKNIDCNGDGQIDSSDIEAINQNFNLDILGGRSLGSLSGNVPLYLDVDTLFTEQVQSFPIIFGEDSAPATEVYGLAFSLRYDSDIIDGSTINVSFDNSWFNTTTAPIAVSRVDMENNLIHVAISKIDGQNISGFGELASVQFMINNTILSLANFQIEQVKVIDADENELAALTPMTGAVVQTVTSVRNNPALAQQIDLYPNPVASRLWIKAQSLDISSYQILGTDGSLIRRIPANQSVLDVSDLVPGMYWLQVITDQGVATKKFVK